MKLLNTTTLLKFFPFLFISLVIISQELALFKGEMKFLTVPLFIAIGLLHTFLSVKFKLANKWIFVFYILIAFMLFFLHEKINP